MGWFRTQQQIDTDIDVLVSQTTALKCLTKYCLNTEGCIINSSYCITVSRRKLEASASLKALFKDLTLSLHISSPNNDLPVPSPSPYARGNNSNDRQNSRVTALGFLRYRVTPKPLVKEGESSDSPMYIRRQRNKVA